VRRTLTDPELDLAGDLLRNTDKLKDYMARVGKYEPDMQPTRIRHVFTVARMVADRLREIEASAKARLQELEDPRKPYKMDQENSNGP